MNVVVKLCIGEIGAAVDLTPFTDDGAPAKMAVGTDHRVFADSHPLFDVCRLWVLKRDARVHPFPVNSLLEQFFHRSELLSGIDSHHLAWIIHVNRRDFLFPSKPNGHYIGQVVFTLLVVVLDLFESRKKKLGRSYVDAGVDFSNPLLRFRRIPLLDDASNLPTRITKDSTVPGGNIQGGGHERQWRLTL